jgi:hypothetical protein
MTELATRDAANVALYADDPTGGRLVAWAQAASAANQLAKALTTTSFVPVAFKGNAGDATAAILMGDELGLSPLAALRSIYVVHGQPAMYARTMVALAQSRGHEIWTEVDTPDKVIVAGRRKGSEQVERSEWTLARARKAGYTGNKKYETNSQEMLYAKAAATVARKVAADVLAGVPYSIEEIELDEPATTVPVWRDPAPTTKVQRAKPPLVAVPEPDLEPSGLDEFHEATTQNPTGPAPSITPRQQAALMASFNEAGITDRTDRLLFCSDATARTIDTTNALSRDEAKVCLDLVKNPGYVEKWREASHGDGTLPVGAE